MKQIGRNRALRGEGRQKVIKMREKYKKNKKKIRAEKKLKKKKNSF